MATTTPISYADTDTSAPAKNINVAGRLITILDACLVNGYGAKAAAGWTKPYTGTNIAVYRMTTGGGSTGFYLYVDDSNTAYTTVRGCESAADAVIANLTNPFPTIAQIAAGSGLYVPRSASGGDWNIIADGRGFYLWCNCGGSPNHVFWFGDHVNYAADAYGCSIIFNTSSATAPSQNNFGLSAGGWSGQTAGHYMARDANGNMSMQFTKLVLGQYALNSSIVPVYPNPGTSNLLMCPWEITNGATVYGSRGKLPGSAMIIHASASIANRSTFSQGSDTYIALSSNTANAYTAIQTNQWVR